MAAAAAPGPAPPGGERPPGPDAGRGHRTSFRRRRVELEQPPRGHCWRRRPAACVGLSGGDSRANGPQPPRSVPGSAGRGGGARRRPPGARRGLGLPGAEGSHRVSHCRAPVASPPGRRCPPPQPAARRRAEPRRAGAAVASGPASPGRRRRSPSAGGADGARGAPPRAARGGKKVCEGERGKGRGNNSTPAVIPRRRFTRGVPSRLLAGGGGGGKELAVCPCRSGRDI